MAGRMGQIEPAKMEERHDLLAQEMLNRGYNHQSPYEQPDISHLPTMIVDINKSLQDLCERCEECRERINLQLKLTRV